MHRGRPRLDAMTTYAVRPLTDADGHDPDVPVVRSASYVVTADGADWLTVFAYVNDPGTGPGYGVRVYSIADDAGQDNAAIQAWLAAYAADAGAVADLAAWLNTS